jgi:hypothetical protein
MHGSKAAMAPEVLDAHVERFNAGVRTGRFDKMLDAILPDAVMRFEGVPVGPFRGRAAIDQAYRDQPPDDTLSLIGPIRHDGQWSTAAYAWDRHPGIRAGEIRLRATDAGVAELVVTFDTPGGSA